MYLSVATELREEKSLDNDCGQLAVIIMNKKYEKMEKNNQRAFNFSFKRKR